MSTGKVLALGIVGFLTTIILVGIFGAPDTSNTGNFTSYFELPMVPNSAAFWFVVIVSLLLAVTFLPKWYRIVPGFLLIVLIGYHFQERWEKVGQTLDRGVNYGEWSTPTPNVEKGPEIVLAGRSGSTIAPTDKWSEWRKLNGPGDCFRAWTNNPTADDLKLRYFDTTGDTWSHDGKYAPDAVAISFQSKLIGPVGVKYETWPKEPGKACKKL